MPPSEDRYPDLAHDQVALWLLRPDSIPPQQVGRLGIFTGKDGSGFIMAPNNAVMQIPPQALQLAQTDPQGFQRMMQIVQQTMMENAR